MPFFAKLLTNLIYKSLKQEEKLTILYGIPNCDTVKKAQKWLIKNNIDFTFHDYRKDGINEALIQQFLHHLSLSDLVNKRSTTYRQLTELQKNTLSAETIIPLFIEFPTLIKRPLLNHNDKYQTGFKESTYQITFSIKG